MARTEIRSGQILDTSVYREDLNIATTGKAVVAKIIAGTNITLGSTGVDTGTGDVTINASGGSGETYATTVTAAGTTTLTSSSETVQYFTGTNTQIVVLPSATTLTVGKEFKVVNLSTGNVTVNKNGGTLSLVIVPNGTAYFRVTDISSAPGTWDTTFIPDMVGSGSAIITFPAVTDTLIGMSGANMAPAYNVTILQNYGRAVPDGYEIVDTYTLEILDSGIFEID